MLYFWFILKLEEKCECYNNAPTLHYIFLYTNAAVKYNLKKFLKKGTIKAEVPWDHKSYSRPVINTYEQLNYVVYYKVRSSVEEKKRKCDKSLG